MWRTTVPVSGACQLPQPIRCDTPSPFQIALGETFTYRYIVRDDSVGERFFETDVYHGITLVRRCRSLSVSWRGGHNFRSPTAQEESHLLAKVASVTVTDSWMKHKEVDFTLPGEHSVLAAVSMTSATGAASASDDAALQHEDALAPLGKPARATVSDAQLEQMVRMRAEHMTSELESQNTELSKRLQVVQRQLASHKSRAKTARSKRAAEDEATADKIGVLLDELEATKRMLTRSQAETQQARASAQEAA